MGIRSNKNKLFLNEVYDLLDYKSGDLIDVELSRDNIDVEKYIGKGQWIETCASINKKEVEFKIDSLFFVQENPVVVFVDASKKQKREIFKIFNSVWSLARPRLVFIENDTSILVYDLASVPAKADEELKPLAEVIKESKQILWELKNFDRASIESGLTFDDKRFDSVNNRADQTLINDLKFARKQLFEHGLNGNKLKYAHALIGRSIFIRYLEDRGVLDKDYFMDIALGNKDELDIIETPLNVSFYREEMRELIYPRILSNRSLTFKLFRKIADDFNGDTFTTDSEEESIISQIHLDLLQNFLLGTGNTGQLPLFLWAYRFDVIPIDLISNIYEEFYHSENLIDEKTKKLKDSKGTHYTPASLVEFVLSRSLNIDVLRTKPRLLDPACGSGIFLVESFRRIVRFELHQKNKSSLELKELLLILKQQIAGIEINPEAIKIAAFSLYLSILNYLNPPNILNYIKKGGKLPYLINHDKSESNHFNILLCENAFNDDIVSKSFANESFDIVVGNPPWNKPSKDDIEGRKGLKIIEEWCETKNLPFPSKEPSQAFIWKAIDFIKEGGYISLLVKNGVLMKNSDISNNYKQFLVNNYSIEEVVNFSRVRRVFFSSAISPFLQIKIKKVKPDKDDIITYISLRTSKSISKNRIVLIDRNDIKRIQTSYSHRNDVWRIFYLGNEFDFKLIESLRRFPEIESIIDKDNKGRGFQESNKSKPAGWLNGYSEYPFSQMLNKFGCIDFSSSYDKTLVRKVPDLVEARGIENIYHGRRILIRRGVIQKIEPKGQIIVRLEKEKFAVRNSIHGFKLKEELYDEYLYVLGVLWSSLFRYYLFMTASTWGTWMQEIHLNEIMKFPIPEPFSQIENQNLIKKTVEELLTRNNKLESEIRMNNPLLDEKSMLPIINNDEKIKSLSNDLDQAVFDLYQLTDFERSLILDRCNFDIDYYYRDERSVGSQKIKDLNYLSDYVRTFKKIWLRRLDKGEVFNHSFITSKDLTMIGVVFKLKNSDSESMNQVIKIDITDFQELLTKEISHNLFSEGLFRRVTVDDQIIIIKRNRKNNWTETEAKIDADAIFLEVLKTPTDSIS